MDKCVFLYRRKEGLSRPEFFRHYIRIHSPLGLRLVRNLGGYTVNLVETAGLIDAITEIWTPTILGVPAPATSFDSEDDAAEMRSDGPRFIDQDHKEGFEVDEQVVQELDTGGTSAPEAKFVWFYFEGEKVPNPPRDARRIVDQRVLRKVYPNSRDIVLIRMAWARDVSALDGVASDALLVSEHRHIEAPA